MPAVPAARRRRAVVAILSVLAAALLGGVVAAPAQAANIDPFVPVFSTNAHGAILMAGNTLMTCSTSSGTNAGTCAAARVAPGGSASNNDYNSQFVDVLADGATTFSSSTADLTIPQGGSVLFAALVWGGRTSGITGTTNNADLRGSAWFGYGSGTAITGGTVTASTVSVSPTDNGYQAYRDVTADVRAHGSGTYAVGNVQSASGGADQYAGWSLVVVVGDADEPMRNLSVFRGYSEIRNATGSREVSFGVSGFLTPPSGTVKTTMGAVTYEGDRGYTGDSFSLNGQKLSDGFNPQDNVFNSTVSKGGSLVTTGRNPAYDNQLGFDADLFTADGILGHGATSATLSATTTSETYWIGMVTFATELYEPNAHGAKSFTWTDRDGNGKVTNGDDLTYHVVVQNDGLDTAADAVLFDAIPTGTRYVPGSLRLQGATLTDATDADAGRFVPDARTGGNVEVRIGDVAVLGTTGAGPDEPSFTVDFTVRITDAVAQQEVVNAAQVTSRGATTGTVSGAVTNRADEVVTGPAATDSAPVLQDHVASVLPTPSTPGVTVDVLAGATDDQPVSELTVVAVTKAAHGTVTLHADGTVTYVPEPGFAGRDVFSYTVEDEAGNVTSALVRVDVVNTPPAAVDDAVVLDVDVPASTATTVDVLGNDTDANGDGLAVRSITVNGTTTTQGSLTTSKGGTVTLSNGVVTYTKPAGGLPVGQTETFTYVVEDSRGATDEGSVTITSQQVNSAPTVRDDQATVQQGGGATPIDVRANDSDADGDALTVTGTTTPVDADGTPRGSVTLVDGSPVYTPPVGWSGTVTFGYTVADGNGGTGSGTVTVRVNAAPVAQDDSETIPSGYAQVLVPVLANDTDADGDTLAIALLGAPSHGSVVIVTTPGGSAFLYTAATGWTGTDTFTYRVSDGHGGSDTATVTVTTPNSAPVAQPDTAGTTVGVTATGVDVLANDSDANATAGFQTLTVTGATADEGATVVVNGDGTLDVTPAAGFVGAVTVSYTLSDGVTTTTGVLTVTVSNTAPAAVADTAATDTGTPVSVDVLGNDGDPDPGQTLTIAPGSLTAPVDGDGTTRGTVAVVDGEVLYTPPAGWAGTVTFSYDATDGHESTTGTVTVTVRNAAPEAQDDSATTDSGTPVRIDVLGNDDDANGDTLTVTSLGTPAHGTVRVVTTASGDVVEYEPEHGFAGDDTFTYVVSDGRGGTATATVRVTVRNAPPVARADEALTKPGRAVTVDVLANDSDVNGDALAIVSVGTPTDASGATRGTATVVGGQVRYTPPAGFTGVVTVSYVITDGADTSSSTVRVAVGPVVGAGDGDTVSTPDDTAVVIDVTAGGETAPVVTRGPAHGTVDVVDGRIVYTPEPGRTGTVTIEYTVTTPGGATETRTVTVVVRDADAGEGSTDPGPGTGGGDPDGSGSTDEPSGSGGSDGPDGPLPTTGAEPLGALAAAVLLLAGGAALVVLARRRRES
ncbi:beta strand repeat-containing protein [Cellulomonas massiliensis]|uniref:beta strand repeat-containing protein n=1 Tax=Cellulomonas massiliensis TaxID=1465811 RepID=UPI0002ED732D|nr:Ig-like domain-containing protein [Cellulomonas massiliensis]